MLSTGLVKIVNIRFEGKKAFGFGNVQRSKASKECDTVEFIILNANESLKKYLVIDSEWMMGGEVVLENGKLVFYVDNLALTRTKGAFYNVPVQCVQSGVMLNGMYRNTAPQQGGYSQQPQQHAQQVPNQQYAPQQQQQQYAPPQPQYVPQQQPQYAPPQPQQTPQYVPQQQQPAPQNNVGGFNYDDLDGVDEL